MLKRHSHQHQAVKANWGRVMMVYTAYGSRAEGIFLAHLSIQGYFDYSRTRLTQAEVTGLSGIISTEA